MELEVRSQESELELAVERRSERMDTAYSPRVHEEEPSAAANDRCRAKASLPAAANLLQQIANGKRNGLCDSLVASGRGMQTVSFCVAKIRIMRARDGIKP